MIRHQPRLQFKQWNLIGMIGGLHVQVAYLTQRGQIPPFAIVLVAVQVMNRQHSLFAVSLVLATMLPPLAVLFALGGSAYELRVMLEIYPVVMLAILNI